jgi:hypothetical protein
MSTSPDLRHASRVLAAVIIPLGPACVALLRFVLPYETNQSASEAIDHIVAHPGRESAVAWLGLAAILTLVPGVMFVGRLTKRHSPRLTAWALMLLVPGYLVLALLVAADGDAWYGATHHFPHDVMEKLYSNGHPILIVGGAIFVLGHVVGTILLGSALLRSHTVPRLAGWLVVVSQPIHFVAAVIVGSHALDLVGWGCNAIGFAAAALAILRLADDDWDLAPINTPVAEIRPTVPR